MQRADVFDPERWLEDGEDAGGAPESAPHDDLIALAKGFSNEAGM